ncbi:MAG: HMA2 domain-containing protein [Candidatus Loosdrechtia sp.]|uniref:HMA2 domain-containing protein n=1 Tax=Candidatus Loosdrechtia sp. TaxID=3101272 RepID=UPI003A69C317|nr:MAG: hypothetical protein QY305_02725 [Candidatus Jettenia sp. AMX2]
MSPLSVLPGRIRFECTCLVGRPGICKYLQNQIKNFSGSITEVMINYRTGRILVKFDEKRIDRQSLSGHINNMLGKYNGSEVSEIREGLLAEGKGKKATFLNVVKHPLVEAVTRVFLPKPFNILIPVAIQGFGGKV